MAEIKSTPTTPTGFAPAKDEDQLKKRQEQASYLRDAMQKARDKGMGLNQALDTVGFDLKNLGTTKDNQFGLSEKEMADYATKAFQAPDTKFASTMDRLRQQPAGANVDTPRLDALAAMQGQPLGSTSMLRQPPRRLGGSGSGGATRSQILQNIFRPQIAEFEAEEKIRRAREDAYLGSSMPLDDPRRLRPSIDKRTY